MRLREDGLLQQVVGHHAADGDDDCQTKHVFMDSFRNAPEWLFGSSEPAECVGRWIQTPLGLIAERLVRAMT